MNPHLPSSLAAVCALLLVCAEPAAAQRRASERASLSQVIDGTTITMEYHRPVARGRANLFGDVVKWDIPWTPGANWATTFEVDKDVQLNGNAVPKGKYSVWMVPRAEGEWTVFLNRKERLFHTQKPKDQADDVVRFTVKPGKSEYLEALTWYIPAIAGDVVTLRMHWGGTYVPIRVNVQPSKPNVLEKSEHAKYIGDYSLKYQDGASTKLNVFSADGKLRARFDDHASGTDAEVDLVPAGDDRFWMASYRGGKYFDTDPEVVVVFRMVANKAQGLELRDGSELFAQAERAR